VDDAPQESEPFADVVTVAPYVLLADLGVQGEEAFHTSGLRENVARVSWLRGLDHQRFLDFKNIFTAEQIDSPGAARELAVEERIVVWTPTDLSDIEFAGNA